VNDYPSWISLAHQDSCSQSHLLTKTPAFSPLYILVCFIVKLQQQEKKKRREENLTSHIFALSLHFLTQYNNITSILRYGL